MTDDRVPLTVALDGHVVDGIAHYAARRGITVEEAIRELVSAGIHLMAATAAGYGLPVPEAVCRRVWAAALRWAADEAAAPFGGAQDGDADSTDLRQWADRIESGELSPWTPITEEDPCR